MSAPVLWETLLQRQKNERLRTLTAERNAGYSQAQAAERLGMKRSQLNNIVRREGIPWQSQWPMANRDGFVADTTCIKRQEFANVRLEKENGMKVLHGIKIPDQLRSRGRPRLYDWSCMEVGDCAEFERQPKGSQAPPCVSAKRWGKQNGWKFKARKHGTGVRIWRVA